MSKQRYIMTTKPGQVDIVDTLAGTGSSPVVRVFGNARLAQKILFFLNEDAYDRQAP